MSKLSKVEFSILSQLREKPMQASDIVTPYNSDVFDEVEQHGFVRLRSYVQVWRKFGVMTICHLTFEGRRALIAHENLS